MNTLEVINVSREVTWLPWAVQYFFLIGLSVTLFGMSLRSVRAAAPGHRAFSRLTVIGAVACGLVAPVALLADLHQPGRFWRFYLHPNFSSWMAWGAFFIPGYLAGLMAYAWAWWKPASRFLRVAAGATMVFAALVLLYTGMEVMVVRARPLWNTPILPLQFVATAIIGAAGFVLVLNRIMEQDPDCERMAVQWLKVSLLATLTLGILWFVLGISGLSQSHAEALASVAGHRQWHLTTIWASMATLLLLVAVWRAPARYGWLVGIVALHAAWMFRWTVFIGGQSVPKTGAGIYAYDLPLGHDGLLGIVGTFGLWLAVIISLATFLPGHAQVAHRLTVGK